jgi:hypothetical protein
MNFQSIKKLQEIYGFKEIQDMINSGQAWKMEGSYGREAMRLLESGVCMLPKKDTLTFYRNLVPSRDKLQAGTKGTFKNSQTFWQGVEDGSIEIDEFAEFEDYDD